MLIWIWKDFKQDFSIFPRSVQQIISLILRYPNFLFVLNLRLIAAFCLLFFQVKILFVLLLFSTILILLRWRGTFNGGSDYMTLVILMSITLATLFKNKNLVLLGCLWYIGIQTCLSYFISGLVKVKVKKWREGSALKAFIFSSNYDQPNFIKQFFKNKTLCLLSSWAVICFELCFPLAFLNPTICLLFIITAFVFHLGNFYVFGLNRFLFAWLASYPALYFCSGGWG